MVLSLVLLVIVLNLHHSLTVILSLIEFVIIVASLLVAFLPKPPVAIDKSSLCYLALNSIEMPDDILSDIKSKLEQAAFEGRVGVRYQMPPSDQVSLSQVMSYLALHGFRVKYVKNHPDTITIIWS